MLQAIDLNIHLFQGFDFSAKAPVFSGNLGKKRARVIVSVWRDR